MNDINGKFYYGYEGENEIDFISDNKTLVIWEGFFDDIMEQFNPSSNGWVGMSYYYHLNTGWYDESPWKILDLKDCLHQFEHLDISKCRFDESQDILIEICNMLSNAIEQDKDVFIAQE